VWAPEVYFLLKCQTCNFPARIPVYNLLAIIQGYFLASYNDEEMNVIKELKHIMIPT
jgi:hypothetical protein